MVHPIIELCNMKFGGFNLNQTKRNSSFEKPQIKGCRTYAYIFKRKKLNLLCYTFILDLYNTFKH